MEDLKSILEEIGYKLQDNGEAWRTTAHYRNGDNATSLAIYHKTGLVVDFVTDEKFSVEELIKRTLGIKDENQWKIWKENNDYQFEFQPSDPKIQIKKVFDKSFLSEIMQDYSYFNKRGISDGILEQFKCGVILAGSKHRMKNRFVFPIFNSKMEVVGLVGRDLTNKALSKWKILGDKGNFVYPAFLNAIEIKEKSQVILVEGIADAVTLFEAGIRQVFCLFGTGIGLGLLNYLLKTGPKDIIIATNSDGPGSEAAIKLQTKLRKYFEHYSIRICLPPKGYKDFNECLCSDFGVSKIQNWKTENKIL